MESTVLRRATQRDAAEAAEVFLRSRRHGLPQVRPVHPDDEVRRWFAETLMLGSEVWVAQAPPRGIAGGIAGAIAGLMALGDGWVEQLYIAPEWTARGIGSRFVDLAKRQWPGGLQLWTFQVNTGARRFYERHGFVPVEFTDGAGNEEQAPDVRYQWPGEGPGRSRVQPATEHQPPAEPGEECHSLRGESSSPGGG